VVGDAQIVHSAFALRSAGGFSNLLNAWQQQSDQYANDCNYNQQFDQSKSGSKFHISPAITRLC